MSDSDITDMVTEDGQDDNLDEDGKDKDLVEDALKAIEDAKQKFNFIRSQRFLSEAVYDGGLPKSGLENNSDTEQCIMDLQDKIDRFCIQEGALQFSLENNTIGKIRSSSATSSELQELLELHFKQETDIKSMASKLFEECSKIQESQRNLTQRLKEYMIYENRRSRELKENSSSEEKESMEKLRKQLKEIRFMQLLIPRLVSQRDGDQSEDEWLMELCQEVRDPILSLDDVPLNRIES